MKPLILWSSVSNSTLKSDLSIDILRRCQRESLLKSVSKLFFVLFFIQLPLKFIKNKKAEIYLARDLAGHGKEMLKFSLS